MLRDNFEMDGPTDREGVAASVDLKLGWLLEPDDHDGNLIERWIADEGKWLVEHHGGRGALLEVAALIAARNPDDKHERAALLQRLWFEPMSDNQGEQWRVAY